MSTQVSTVATQQLDLPFLCLMEPPVAVSQEVVESVSTECELVAKAIELSRYKFMQKTMAAHLGLSPSQFSKIKNGKDAKGKVWHLPVTSIAAFECLVGHTLITQWIAYQRDCLFDSDVRHLSELKLEMAELQKRIEAKKLVA